MLSASTGMIVRDDSGQPDASSASTGISSSTVAIVSVDTSPGANNVRQP